MAKNSVAKNWLEVFGVPREMWATVLTKTIVDTCRIGNQCPLVLIVAGGEDNFIASINKTYSWAKLDHHEIKLMFATIVDEARLEAASQGPQTIQ